MRALGVLVPVGGYNTSTSAGTKNLNGKQQWCYLCGAGHDYHQYVEG